MRAPAKRRAPWAFIILKAEEGFWCFESFGFGVVRDEALCALNPPFGLKVLPDV